jgi:UDP-GlcNAc:undecaprenyl-phosphate/decaprenyl-phosphate GlcNAc-1-phosphate transferase
MLLKFFSLVVAFLSTVLFILALRPLAWRIGWVDKPDARKQHGTAIPLVGGVAMLGGLFVATFVSGKLINHYPLLLAMSALCLVGLADDLLHIAAARRLLLQGLVALLMCLWDGTRLDHLGALFGFDPVILNDWQSLFVTVFCIMSMVNAINMIDGVDGLAGGVLVTALFWLAVIGINTRGGALLPMELVACLFGYLCFNLRSPWRVRATVFMGDAGSTMLGLAVTWLMIRYSGYHEAIGRNFFPPVVILWLLAIPLYDTVSLIISRGLRGHHPFKADRDHIHHVLMRAGLNDRDVSAVVIALAFLLGGVGVLGWLLHIAEFVLFYGFVLLFIAYYYLIHHSDQAVQFFRRK